MSGGWCDCGLAMEDPLHERWHKLLTWNGYIFNRAEQERQAAFDKELEVHNHRHGRTPPDPQGRMDVSGAVTTAHRYEG